MVFHEKSRDLSRHLSEFHIHPAELFNFLCSIHFSSFTNYNYLWGRNVCRATSTFLGETGTNETIKPREQISCLPSLFLTHFVMRLFKNTPLSRFLATTLTMWPEFWSVRYKKKSSVLGFQKNVLIFLTKGTDSAPL